MRPRIFCSLLLSSLLAGGPAVAADLLQLYRDALLNDTQYAAARANADAAREKLPQGLAGLLPTVSASANTTWNDNDFTGTRRKFNSNGYNVSLTQPLFRWQNYVQYSQAQLQLAQAEAALAQARIDLTLRVSQAYFDVLNAEENLLAVQANKVFIAEQLKQAKKNFEFGTVTITDTHEAQARHDLATAQEITATSDLRVKRGALRLIIGKLPGTLARLKPQATLALPQPSDADSWAAAAEVNNFAVLAQQAALEVAEKEVSRNRAGHYPIVDMVANYGRSNSGVTQYIDSRTEVLSGNVGVQLTIPIFQGGAVNSKVREAMAGRDATRAGLEEVRRKAVLNASEAYLGVENGIAQVHALEAALVSSASALASNKVGYKVGVRINIDVLNAEQQVYSTRRDLAKVRFETLLAQLKLKAAVGSLDEEDLQQLGMLFEGGNGVVDPQPAIMLRPAERIQMQAASPAK